MTNVRRWHQAAGAFVVASTSAVWFLVGQLSEDGGADYILKLPQPGRYVELVVGVVSLLAAIVAGSVISRRRDLLVQWLRVYGRLLVTGLAIAIGGRVVTAASGGANIGGAGLLIIGPFPLFYILERTRYELRLLTMRTEPNPWSPSYLSVLLTLAELALGATLLWSLTPHHGG